MNEAKKDWMFILLCLGLVMAASYLLSSCEETRCSAAPKAGHGPCPISGCPELPADPRKN